ncbi:SDR family oxidoreductase [Foetidibacter luteolus]|uniref:SDR family oxidoreductase n=1 Tax=Foetidibacter luteolus TaxID=2608880 RepID=UPI00129B5730|nr:SDR family oxidoreductase [Foetidibacter luteolus]
MYNVKDKVVVVTGGSEGIGKALVDVLLQKGAKVATCGRDYDKLYVLQTQYPGKPLLIYAADVSRQIDCENFINETIKLYGTIDILVNNAGLSMRALFSETELETLKRLMDVNFWGAVYCTKFALPYILKQKGQLVSVSSVAGYRGLPGRTGYSASKHALNGWMEALRTELLYSGVNVMWVCPGFTSSNIRNAALNKNAEPQGESPLNEKQLMSAEECAAHIMEAIEKRKRTIVLTTQGKETVYLNKILPALADKLVYRFFYKKGQLVN